MTTPSPGSSLPLDPGRADGELAPRFVRGGPACRLAHLALTPRLAGSTAVHVGFAAVAMGGWALLVNSGHGLAAALPPALGQGVLSGTITLLLKRALEAMSGRFPGPLAYLAPPFITAGVILAVLLIVHRLIGTPEILRTIAVPWGVSTTYAFLYTAALARRRLQEPTR